MRWPGVMELQTDQKQKVEMDEMMMQVFLQVQAGFEPGIFSRIAVSHDRVPFIHFERDGE
jgi:hypothetical protein